MTNPGRIAFASTPLLAIALMAAPARADDAKTQKVDAGGLTFQAPADWKQTAPESQMRRAQLKIEPVKGDDQGAELIIFAFPGGAGSVEANIDRWQRTFKDKDGNPPRADRKTVKGKNTDVTRVELAGHYFPTTFPGQPKQADRPDSRLLGAIVQTDQTGYFLRLVGPEKTVAAARPAFDKMLATLEVGDK